MNLPNSLTLARVALTAVFLVAVAWPGQAAKAAAFVTFLVAAATDWLDGRIARSSGQITPFGKLMDPIADKVLTVSAFISFVQMGLVAAWAVVIIVLRDLAITGMRLAMPAGEGGRAADPSGKFKTALQLGYIVAVLAFIVLREGPSWDPVRDATAVRAVRWGMLVIVAVTLWSGAEYAARHRRQVR